MLVFIHGDIEKARKKMHTYLNGLKRKRPDAEVFRLTSENFDRSQLEEFIGGRGLFEDKYIVILDQVFEDPEAKEKVLEHVKEIGESENAFIILEGALDSKTKRDIEKHTERTEDCTEKKKKQEKDYSIFALTDALGKRDEKGMWVEYWKAIRSGKSAEEIHAILFWQAKSLLAASKTQSAKEAGMKGFPYKKAKGYAKNFLPEELAGISRSLVILYHDARRGKHGLEEGMEKWILSV